MKRRIACLGISLCMMAALFLPLPGTVPAARAADDAPTYCTGAHTGYTAIPDEAFFSSRNYTLSAGEYYLSADIDVAHRISFSGRVTLCLNGHRLRGTAASYTSNVFLHVTGGAHLTILDCKAFTEWDAALEDFAYVGGRITVNENVGAGVGAQINTASASAYALQVNGSSTVCDFRGGSICDSVGRFGAVLVNGGGTLNMYDDASIRDNDCSVIQTIGGGVDLQGGATFNMYGGRITGNRGRTGGGVALANPDAAGSTFNMYGGEISGNTATNGNGGGVCVVAGGGAFNLYGGRVVNNEAKTNGGGVYLANVAGIRFRMYGGELAGNTAAASGGSAVCCAGANAGATLYRGAADGTGKGKIASPFTVNGTALAVTNPAQVGAIASAAADFDPATATLTVKQGLTGLEWEDDADFSPTVKLEADLDVFPTVPAGQTAAVELNGYTLDAGGITNGGTLIVSDGSEAQTGRLVGSVTGGTVLRLDKGLQVGYGKAPITPVRRPDDDPTHELTTASLPMAGYGDNINRRALVKDGDVVRIDDNGDGVVDERDGQFATCIAVRDGEGHTLLLISADTIGAHDSLTAKLKNHVNGILGIPGDYVYLNASHTHSGVDLGWYFGYATKRSNLEAEFDGDTLTDNSSYNQLATDGHPERQTVVQDMQKFVYYTLLPGLMNAAEQALDDLSPAAMSTGTANPEQLNFIRHAYRSGSGDAEARVYGVNTRTTNGDGTFTAQYDGPDGQKVNDHLYLLQFTRAGKPTVLAVDWRGHATSASTSGSKYGLAHRDRISSDYINSFRHTLEQKGYQVSFFQGTAGNVNTVSLLGKDASDQAVIRQYTYGGGSNYGVVPYLYGRRLAGYALQAAEGSIPLSAAGGVQSTVRSMTAQLDTSENDKMYKREGDVRTGMLVETVTDHNNVTRTEYEYLKTYYAYVTTPAAEQAQVTALLNKYNLNSQYHLGRIKSKFDATMKKIEGTGDYEPKASQTGSFDLCAFTIGSQVAGIAGPFELFDYPYTGIRTQGGRAVTFVLGYTNGSKSYMPTADTFRFAHGRGAYEANNTAYAPGTAENIGARHLEMLASLDRSGLPDECPHCQRAVTWIPLPPTGNITVGGHYYLPQDMNISQKNINGGKNSAISVCLHLNGHTLSNNSSAASRIFAIQEGATLNVMGEGTIVSKGVKDEETGLYQHAGVILINGGTTLNLYGGTIKRLNVDGRHTVNGGAVSVNGTMHMYGGRLLAEKPDPDTVVTNTRGGVVYVGSGGVFTMEDGLIAGGEVQQTSGVYYGHNVYVASGGAFDFRGGAVQCDGERLPSIYVDSGGGFTQELVYRAGE